MGKYLYKINNKSLQLLEFGWSLHIAIALIASLAIMPHGPLNILFGLLQKSD
jgi:hypothetical protein